MSRSTTRAPCIGLWPALSAALSLAGFYSSTIIMGTVTRIDFRPRSSPSAGQHRHRDAGRIPEGKTSLGGGKGVRCNPVPQMGAGAVRKGRPAAIHGRWPGARPAARLCLTGEEILSLGERSAPRGAAEKRLGRLWAREDQTGSQLQQKWGTTSSVACYHFRQFKNISSNVGEKKERK